MGRRIRHRPAGDDQGLKGRMSAMSFDSNLTPRHILQLIAGASAFAIGVSPSAAGEERISRLIGEAKTLPGVAQRVDFIAAALRGTRYRGSTLIGGPRRKEKFVARDD